MNRTPGPWLFAALALGCLLAAGVVLARPATAHTPARPSAFEATLDATADTWLDEANPDTNHGADGTLSVGETYDVVAARRHLLVAFDLSGLPAGAEIVSAELRLQQTEADGASALTVVPELLLDPWTEGDVTWENPLASEYRGDPVLPLSSDAGLKTFDITNIVAVWVDGSLPNHGLILHSDGSALATRTFAGREQPDLAPRLAVTYTVAGPTNTPTQTPTFTPTYTPTFTPTFTPTKKPTSTPTATKPAPKQIDLIALSFEITQGIQDMNNSVRLVANKRTFVRLHVRSAGVPVWGSAQLTLYRQASQVTLKPIVLPGTSGGNLLFPYMPDRAVLNQAFLFELPSGWRSGALMLSATVWPTAGWYDGNLANNTISRGVLFEEVPPLRLTVYRMGYEYQGQTYYPSTYDVFMLWSWLRRAYPVHSVQLKMKEGLNKYPWVFQDNEGNPVFAIPNCGGVNNRLFGMEMKEVSLFENGFRVYGMVSDEIAFMRGCSGIPSVAASGPTGPESSWDQDGSYGDWYGGHELGHSLGRKHVKCSGDEAKPDSSYPYLFGWISTKIVGDGAFMGFDALNYTLYPPTWTDVMTYCNNEWISKYTYEGIMNRLKLAAAAQQAQVGEAPAPVGGGAPAQLLVRGIIDMESGEATLEPLVLYWPANAFPAPAPGDYTLVLRDPTRELLRIPITPHELDGGPLLAGEPSRSVSYLQIVETIPALANLASVALEGPGGELARISAGPGAPVVAFTAPEPGAEIADGPVQVAWNASDPDDDPLSWLLLFSSDNGVTWTGADAGDGETTAAVPRMNLRAGGEARFRLLVSDGIHTTVADMSGPFSLENVPPAVTILQPEQEITLYAGHTLALEAFAYDFDAGLLDGASVGWSSDLGGALGSGVQTTLPGLPVGRHTITVSASDAEGDVATDSVVVNVIVEPTTRPPDPLLLPLIRR